MLLRLQRRDWECQGGVDTELGLGRRQMFQDREVREGILLGVEPGERVPVPSPIFY